MRRITPALLLLIGCAAPPADPAVLMDADRAFAAAVAEDGADAWAAWFAEDGAMIQAGVGEVRGRDAIREAVAYLDRPGLSLQWEPERADIAASGDLGWTTGSWQLRQEGPDGPIASRGRYVSIWRRQPVGSWKVVMDLGNPVESDAGA